MKNTKIFYILPCFNEELNLQKLLTDFFNFYKSKKFNINIVIINDGSNDNSLKLLKKFKKKFDKKNYLINDVVEKPTIKSAPSNKAVIGRYILPKDIFSKLSKQKLGKGGELHITDAIQSLIDENYKFIAHNFSGKYLDCGSMDGYIKSSLEISKL